MSKKQTNPIGANLQRLRINRGMTVRGLAERSGIPSIGSIESGQSLNPGINTLRPICEALGVSIDELTLSPREYAALRRRRAKVGK